jgi:hypothetical protein
LGQLGGFVGLIKAITDWRAGTVTEAAYTGYGTRPAITWDSTEDTSPAGGRQVKNSGAISFPVNTGANEDQIAWGIWSAATAGTLHAIGLLDTDQPIVGVGNVDDTIDAYAHGLSTDQRVYVMAAPGMLLPAGLSENVAYFVLASGLTADVFKLSTTSAGSAVNVTVGGAALFIPYTARTVATGATPQIADDAIIAQI